MKHLLVMTILAMTPFLAHALAADSFSCTLKVVDQTTGDENVQTQDFQTARLPFSFSPAIDVRLSGGRFSTDNIFNTKNNQITTNVFMYYKHATKVDDKGDVLDARQFTCVTISSSACSKDSGDGFRICANSKTFCAGELELDPFKDPSGWPKVGIFKNLPVFDMKFPIHNSTTIKDENDKPVGTATVDCKFNGTYQ